MLSWLEAAHQRGIEVLIGDPERTYFPGAVMELLAVERVTTSRELEERKNEKGRDLHLSRRNVGCAPLSIQNLD